MEKWKHEQQKKGLSCSYDNMERSVKNVVHNSLIKEQGSICCYTGIRISVDSSHIEHLKPQTICVGNEDVEYNNLLAAYPRPDPRNLVH
ncbi:MAG: hypothetical protein IPK14_14885 [Blastocatellia bacterium]|nr:hypothetical protein [Blastocatellia bacterium]